MKTLVSLITFSFIWAFPGASLCQEPKTNAEVVISFKDLQCDSGSGPHLQGITHFHDGVAFFDTNSPPRVEGTAIVTCGRERLLLSEPEVEYEGTVTVLVWTNVAGTPTQRQVFLGAAAELITFKRQRFQELSDEEQAPTNASAVRLFRACRLTNAVVSIREYGNNPPSVRKVEWVVKTALPSSSLEQKK